MWTINEWNFNELRQRFPDYEMDGVYPAGSWQTSRYIQIFLPGQDKDLHYEYRIDHEWKGRIELHFEGEWDKKYAFLIDNLIDRTQNNSQISWSEWGYGYRCQYLKEINSLDELHHGLSCMMETFNASIRELTLQQPQVKMVELDLCDTLGQQEETVDILLKSLEDVLRLPLSIPDYQRIYCWEERNVKCLLDDLFAHLEKTQHNPVSVPYRLGTIILHNVEGKYDIIDGQQRLVTLSLLLREMGVFPRLLNEKLTSKRSLEYVAYNRHLISGYLQRNMQFKGQAQRLLSMIEFSVLVLKNASLDLAYTFFSNQNSRGVKLTDYDLLKAHHLRYIPSSSERQSMHAAEVWNKMIENGRTNKADATEQPDYVCTLDTYIYRLRKWMRKHECDDSTDKYRIKQEYEAAPVVEEIPPFGEHFYFNEPIQGGTHFFSFVEQHLDKYRQFAATPEYSHLHAGLDYGSHRWYRDVIEALMFGYYLKFGSYYLSDATVAIMRIILQHRYDNRRAQKASIVQYAADTELVLMIDQATSPTFFLAEARDYAKELTYPVRQDMGPIMLDMRRRASNISGSIRPNIVIESLKNINR